MINLNIRKNYINILIFIILSINSSINFASIRNIENSNFFNKKITIDKLKLIDYRLISKDFTLEKLRKFSKVYNSQIAYLKRKIIIRNDYLKLIKIFPSKHNIKKDDLKKEIKILESKKDYFLNIYQNKIMKDTQYFKNKSGFSFYKVIYKYKITENKNKTNILNWVTYCPINDNNNISINIFRKKLLNEVYSNNFLPKRLNIYYIQRDLYNEFSEFEIDRIICSHFRNSLKNKNQP